MSSNFLGKNMGQYKRCNNHNQPTCHVYHLQALCDLDLQPFYLSSSYLLMHCLGVLLRYRDNLQLQSHIVEVSKVDKKWFNKVLIYSLWCNNLLKGRRAILLFSATYLRVIDPLSAGHCRSNFFRYVIHELIGLSLKVSPR